MTSASGPLFERVSRSVAHDSAQRWWVLSEETYRAARGADHGGVLRKLDAAAGADPGSPLSPAFRLWAADVLGRVSRDREAAAAYDRVIAAAESAPPFEGIDFTRQALWSRAAAQARLGSIDAATESFRELAKRGETDAL